ncbi:hypothetical protein DFH09DRAFT_1342891 [Mycena vulgaris]|nr:hypothetical protein DFH09DRAFT_1342891 [Mycena vulgaris]
MVDFDPIFPLLPLTVAGVLRWLNLHPHPCKPSQIGASHPPGPSSSPSYRFGNILGSLALAVSRASNVCKHDLNSSAVHAPFFLTVYFGMANKTARTSQQEACRKHGRRMDGGDVSTPGSLSRSSTLPQRRSLWTHRTQYNHFVLPGSGSQLRLRATAGAPLLDLLFSIALSM